jgi:hypothetical protein
MMTTRTLNAFISCARHSLWVNGAGNAAGVARSCGPGCTTTVGEDGNLGVFTTGLTAIWDLGRWIPKNYGGWYVKGGFQWYDLINSNLVLSENESVGCAINANESCKTSKSIWVGFVGIGASF